jgi:hypothetical protein
MDEFNMAWKTAGHVKLILKYFPKACVFCSNFSELFYYRNEKAPACFLYGIAYCKAAKK